jgi:hypothetical integral membrane protein (TIGR02206 family)
MSNSFFLYEPQLQPGMGFPRMGAVHLSFLAGIAAFLAVITRFYIRSGENRRREIRIGLSIACVALEVLKDLVVWAIGFAGPQLLPLHMCGLTILVMSAHTIVPRKMTGEVLFCLSMPGALSALLFPDWSVYPILCFFPLHSFIIHALEISYPLVLLASGELRPRLANIWRPALFLAVIVPPVYFLNHALDTNFFFVNDAAPGSPLSAMAAVMGSPGYIFGFMGLVAAVWLVMYAAAELVYRLRSRRGARI